MLLGVVKKKFGGNVIKEKITNGRILFLREQEEEVVQYARVEK